MPGLFRCLAGVRRPGAPRFPSPAGNEPDPRHPRYQATSGSETLPGPGTSVKPGRGIWRSAPLASRMSSREPACTLAAPVTGHAGSRSLPAS